MSKLFELSSTEMSVRFSQGLDPRDVAEEVISRIEECEPRLNAFYLFDPDSIRKGAEESARRWAAGKPLSKFDGVPVTVKENITRKGKPVPSGTAVPNPPIAPENSPIVDRLEEHGLVILGSTTMPDWGMLSSGVSSLHGITRNAWNPSLTTGGSSAGAGAAAAAGYGPLHVGSDIGGSIRLPGTWAGLATLKPSEGLVPLHAPYLGRAAGPMARTISDVQALMSLIAREDPRDYSTRPYPAMDWSQVLQSPSGMRVGLQLDAGCGASVEPEIADAVVKAAKLFEDAGAEIVEVEPFISEPQLAGIDAFWRTRSWVDFSRLSTADQARITPHVAKWCEEGAQFSGGQTMENYHRFGEVQKATRSATEGFDLVLSPVAPMAAFAAEAPMPFDDPRQPMQHISFTMPYNFSGQPAATVNCGFTTDGRTIGLQVAGHIGADDQVLAACRWFESIRGSSAPDWTAVWSS